MCKVILCSEKFDMAFKLKVWWFKYLRQIAKMKIKIHKLPFLLTLPNLQPASISCYTVSGTKRNEIVL